MPQMTRFLIEHVEEIQFLEYIDAVDKKQAVEIFQEKLHTDQMEAIDARTVYLKITEEE